MNKKAKTFNILIYEAHLLGEMKKVMKLLKKRGKYFYIKHYKNDIVPHYHIYYESDILTTEYDVQALFSKYVASKVFEQEYIGSKMSYIEYLLGHNEYKRSDIVSTMSLK